MKLIFVAILATLALYSCRKDEPNAITGNDDLVGTWVNPQYNDTLITYISAAALKENEPGYTFKTDYSLICRENSGWCGTPPITTADYGGSWIMSDSIVTIKTSYWGGKVEYTWKIITLTNQKLVVWVQKAEYQGGK